MRRTTVINSAKCEGCINYEKRTYKDDKLELVHCVVRNKTYVFGQQIAPCEEYRKKDEK